MTISACLIVRNESRIIERCLKSLKGVDEIVVLDTGSTDRTPDICVKNKARVYYDVWRDDFSEARNKAISYCTGDWIISIDADEYFPSGAIIFIQDFIKKNKGDVFTCYVRTDETLSLQPRIFRNNLERIYWKGAAHNYINRQADNHINVEITSTSEGWRRTNDPEQGIRILKNYLLKEPNAGREMYYLGKEYQGRCQWELAIYYLSEAEEIYPSPEGRTDIHLSIAKCYIHLKRTRKAINHLHEVLKLNPDTRECYQLLHRLTKKGIYAKLAKTAENRNMLIQSNDGND